jgi:diguanylate cyclase (GGDEF)-like protein
MPAPSTESISEKPCPSNPVIETEHLHELWQREITEQNEKHLVALFVALLFGSIAYTGYDYFSLPALWFELLWWRLLGAVCGIASLVLFLHKRISALTAATILFLSVSLYLGYFASRIDDSVHLTVWNMNVGASMFILPLALLTVPTRLNISLIGIFVANYLFWYFLNSPFSFSELFIYGGAFVILAMLIAFFGHWSKVRSAKQLAELRFTIETKNHEILEQNRKLEIQATYDTLTGAFNRGAGLQILEDRIRLNQRDGLDLTIVYVDVDNLKTTNDGLGHKFGDQLILGVVDSIRGSIRDVDLICRMGGDEFLVVMSGCDLAEAKHIMNRISTQLERLSAGSAFPFEISWGALSYSKDDFTSLGEFIEGADHIMYEAKQKKKRLRQEVAFETKHVI